VIARGQKTQLDRLGTVDEAAGRGGGKGVEKGFDGRVLFLRAQSSWLRVRKPCWEEEGSQPMANSGERKCGSAEDWCILPNRESINLGGGR